jgi:hypothetical protein
MLGTFGAAAALPGCAATAAQGGPAGSITDADIFNFALNLESLETEYYLRGTTGRGMDDADAGPNPGAVNGGRMVPWQNADLRQFMEEVARNELAHVRFYRRTLGDAAVSRPAIDLAGGFAAAAQAAGLGDDFDPFASEMNFFLGGMLMEDVGVTAYKGAAPLIANKSFLEAAAGILAVEAYHAGLVRTVLLNKGLEVPAGAISDARDSLDGSTDLDQGIVDGDGNANLVPTDANGIAFSRSAGQVLNIAYLNPAAVTEGGFFPHGVNGEIDMSADNA